jgi:tetratricopeptide (TPR) repeat protein
VRPRLFLSYDPWLDSLAAPEFGRVTEGQPDGYWRPVADNLALLLDEPDGRPVGFMVHSLAAFDADEAGDEVWGEPRFDAPVLGLRDAPIGEIVIAARSQWGDRCSFNRELFDRATRQEGALALGTWEACLESGDQMAHFGIGYTLLDLGRRQEGYRHLRYYAELAPEEPWVQRWLGKAALAIGEREEAIRAFERAIELEEEGGAATDAADLLAELV